MPIGLNVLLCLDLQQGGVSCLISWKCTKKDHVSKFSTEAESRIMSSAYSEILWVHGLLAEHFFPLSSPTSLHANNKSVIQLASNPIFHEQMKHIQLATLPHVSSSLQLQTSVQLRRP